MQMRQGSIGIKVRAPPRASLISQSSATVIAISCDAVPARCASCCRTTPPARTASRPPSQTSSRLTSLPLSRRRKHVVQFLFCSKIGWFGVQTLRLTIAALELFWMFSRNTILGQKWLKMLFASQYFRRPPHLASVLPSPHNEEASKHGAKLKSAVYTSQKKHPRPAGRPIMSNPPIALARTRSAAARRWGWWRPGPAHCQQTQFLKNMRAAASTSCVTAPSPAKPTPRSFCKTSRVLVRTACSATHQQKTRRLCAARSCQRTSADAFADGRSQATAEHVSGHHGIPAHPQKQPSTLTLACSLITTLASPLKSTSTSYLPPE